MSVHGTPGPFHPEFRTAPPWHTHASLQDKLKELHESASVLRENYHIAGEVPVVNDELAYQGAGDGWSREDVVEAHLGALLGGGYASTGYKPGNKVTQYFWGDFDPGEHTAAPHLRWLAERIERHVTFWNTEPIDLKESVFEGFRTEDVWDSFTAIAWPGREYALGSDTCREGSVRLPPGTWKRVQLDALATTEETTTVHVDDAHTFETPASRAGLTHFSRVE